MFHFFDVIDSTNTEASRLLEAAQTSGKGFLSCHKDVVWALSQTAGRGRLGRSFFSPESGVYFSLIFCPEKTSEDFDPAIYTAVASVAVCRSLKKLYNKDSTIKWVNDVYVNEKKVCGILTEGKIDTEKNIIGALVIGIGINIYTPKEKFPEEIRNRAGSVLESEKERNNVTPEDLVREIVSCACKIYENSELLESTMQEYKDRSNLIGKKITVTPVIEQNEGRYEALVKDITQRARLVVQLEDGSIRELSSGEVSLHM